MQHEYDDLRFYDILHSDRFTVMIAETISLGILSLPSVLATVGMVGGGILIITLGIVATYSGYVIGLVAPVIH